MVPVSVITGVLLLFVSTANPVGNTACYCQIIAALQASTDSYASTILNLFLAAQTNPYDLQYLV
ncbi:hypothetical protein SCLCIDRAFT_21851 [Scleroderma citrinum Foug A]|uniref:Uncharacterized protein n=1 Tax=Scleroderma citrinum Foug A TaxID=1036808 RepID=A0A0C2ZZ49_9AGAM|nr:hypothetical protein SCLCIDRAFT_21851 [Scleroderma citrinum Foug A]